MECACVPLLEGIDSGAAASRLRAAQESGAPQQQRDLFFLLFLLSFPIDNHSLGNVALLI